MPNKGDIGYEVEWCPQNKRNLAIAADEDRDYSQMDCEFRVVTDIELARKLAKVHAPKSMFSSAMIRKVVYNQYRQWERVDEELEEVCA